MVFTKGHKINLGKKHSVDTIQKISDSMFGYRNPQWKGDDVSYSALHGWVRRNLLKPSFCDMCKTNNPLDVANISGNYLRDLTDWQWLCRKCHMLSDGRYQIAITNLENRPTIRDPNTGRFVNDSGK